MASFIGVTPRETIPLRPTRRLQSGKDSYQNLCTMQNPMMTIFFITVMLAANVSGQNGMLAPPNRPNDLKNPGVLNNYLKALNEYQDALSRPRFGRSLNKRFSFNEFDNSLPKHID